MGFYSAYRLKRFGLDGVIDTLFSPNDHEIPSGVSIEKLRRHPDDFYQLQVTNVRHTPPGELKPNPRVLLDIIKSVGATADRCAYIGDSLFKDVAMARDVGVLDIHAQYGESQRRPEYNLLQRVSHWTQEDVEREAAITAKGTHFTPTITLKDSFAEIFIHCDFAAFSPDPREISAEQEAKNAIEIWKKCVDVQQHFNDLEMRIRNFALAVVGALIAAISFTYQQNIQTSFFGASISASAALVAAALFAWGGFFFMDQFWYHVLLKGAVSHTGKIEKQYEASVPGIGLGVTISEASGKVRVFGFPMNSDRRLKLFYAVGAILLCMLLIFFLSAQPSQQALGSKPMAAPSTSVTQSSKAP